MNATRSGGGTLNATMADPEGDVFDCSVLAFVPFIHLGFVPVWLAAAVLWTWNNLRYRQHTHAPTSKARPAWPAEQSIERLPAGPARPRLEAALRLIWRWRGVCHRWRASWRASWPTPLGGFSARSALRCFALLSP